MENTISLAKNYTKLVDEKYMTEALTSDLNSPASLARQGANAKEILYRKVSVLGLGDYSRSSGYTSNKVTIAWATATFNYDRGTKIGMDQMDNEETMGDSFLIAQNELQTYHVAPEGDAFTFATIAGTSGVSEVEATYADSSEFLTALITAKNTMDDDHVPTSQRYLYATPTLLNGIMALDTTKSREIMATFEKVIQVPQDRFYTAIDLLSDEDEDSFGYQKATAGELINFMIVHKPAVIKFDKHVVSDVIPAALNPDADEDISKYRKYGLVEVYENKVAGIYVSHQASSVSL